MDNLLLFGGTFDPIHYGHIKTAAAIQDYFHFDALVFLPCKDPVLIKKSQTSQAAHRLAMLQLALSKQDSKYHFQLDPREIIRESPSYMVTTLEAFRLEQGEAFPITFLLGLDAFAQLSLWYQWERLLELANILVINRHGFDEHRILAPVQKLLKRHETKQTKELLTTSHGLIARFDAGQYAISSTSIRQALWNNTSLEEFLPMEVIEYIQENSLYISS